MYNKLVNNCIVSFNFKHMRTATSQYRRSAVTNLLRHVQIYCNF